jgi:hypothetical protein
MKLIWWMLAGSVLSAVAVTVFLEAGMRLEVWLGMLGPLAVAVISWIAMERQYRRKPAAMTSLMIKAFAAKMVFFAGYVTVLLSSGLVEPIPFVISFMAYFVSLHAAEAVGLRRLQTANPPAASGAL